MAKITTPEDAMRNTRNRTDLDKIREQREAQLRSTYENSSLYAWRQEIEERKRRAAEKRAAEEAKRTEATAEKANKKADSTQKSQQSRSITDDRSELREERRSIQEKADELRARNGVAQDRAEIEALIDEKNKGGGGGAAVHTGSSYVETGFTTPRPFSWYEEKGAYKVYHPTANVNGVHVETQGWVSTGVNTSGDLWAKITGTDISFTDEPQTEESNDANSTDANSTDATFIKVVSKSEEYVSLVGGALVLGCGRTPPDVLYDCALLCANGAKDVTLTLKQKAYCWDRDTACYSKCDYCNLGCNVTFKGFTTGGLIKKADTCPTYVYTTDNWSSSSGQKAVVVTVPLQQETYEFTGLNARTSGSDAMAEVKLCISGLVPSDESTCLVKSIVDDYTNGNGCAFVVKFGRLSFLDGEVKPLANTDITIYGAPEKSVTVLTNVYNENNQTVIQTGNLNLRTGAISNTTNTTVSTGEGGPTSVSGSFLTGPTDDSPTSGVNINPIFVTPMCASGIGGTTSAPTGYDSAFQIQRATIENGSVTKLADNSSLYLMFNNQTPGNAFVGTVVSNVYYDEQTGNIMVTKTTYNNNGTCSSQDYSLIGTKLHAEDHAEGVI